MPPDDIRPRRLVVRGPAALLAGALLALTSPAFADGDNAPDKPVATAPDKAPPTTIVEGLTVIGQRARSERGPGVSRTGANAYTVTGADIANMPLGTATPLSDVLTQMPGVSIDQNQQIHIRNTEGPQFQYQINGVLVPFDINTNPPFLSMINPMFIKQLDLLDGILPSRYSYATGGVVEIQTKDGCEQPGGSVTFWSASARPSQPSAQYGGCAGELSYYRQRAVTPRAKPPSARRRPARTRSMTTPTRARRSASSPIRSTRQTRLSLVFRLGQQQPAAQCPGPAPATPWPGVPTYPSANINSYLNFRDYLAILSLNGLPPANSDLSAGLCVHSISQNFRPDRRRRADLPGRRLDAPRTDLDDTLQGDLGRAGPAPTRSGAGFYAGAYDVSGDNASLVFPATPMDEQTSSTPIQVINDAQPPMWCWASI